MASSNTSPALTTMVIPLYGTCPALVNVDVNLTTAPGVVVATFAVSAIVSTATFNVTVQLASVLPEAQLLPVVADVRVLVRMSLPVSGLLTVTEKVTVTLAPTARLPVQVRLGLEKLTEPPVADASPLYLASSSTPLSG